MYLRAISVSGRIVNFGIKDCPIVLNDKAVILLNRPNSPILQLHSIARVSQESGMAEYDFVVDGQYNLIGYVIYNKGFKVYTNSGEIIPFEKDFKVLYNSTYIPNNKIRAARSSLTFVYDDISFSMFSLVTCFNNVGYVFSKNLKSIDLDKVKFATGYKIKGNDICFGDTIDDGTVVLHDLKPMIKKADEYLELRSEEHD